MEETVSHVFVECPFAGAVWGELGRFFQGMGPLSWDVVMLGLGLRGRGRAGFLLWLLISVGKTILWDARQALVRHRVDWGVGGIVARVRAELRRRRALSDLHLLSRPLS